MAKGFAKHIFLKKQNCSDRPMFLNKQCMVWDFATMFWNWVKVTLNESIITLYSNIMFQERSAVCLQVPWASDWKEALIRHGLSTAPGSGQHPRCQNISEARIMTLTLYECECLNGSGWSPAWLSKILAKDFPARRMSSSVVQFMIIPSSYFFLTQD